MKNVETYELKKVIYLKDHQFEQLLYEVFGEDKTSCLVDIEGLHYSVEGMDFHEINARLAKHFGVKRVTSIHADDCDYTGIWICYSNKD